ncbi:MAG: LCP family protein [bacterium]
MKKTLIIIIVSLFFLAAATGFIVALASKLSLYNVFFALTPTETVFPEANILLLGIDDAFGHRADTIMVLHTNPANNQAALISIPRDTLAVLPGRGLDKINHAYAYGGVELTRQSVEQMLNIEIPYYIIVNLAGIANIIDELGGVKIEVEKRMYYVDHAANLYIDLEPGQQTLSGKEVMGYLRYRRDGGDFSRISRQHKFLTAMADELLKKSNLVRSPAIFLTLLSYLDTNLNSKQTIALSLGLRRAYELGQVKMATLPGTDLMIDGIYYWKADTEALKQIVKQFIKEPKLSYNE